MTRKLDAPDLRDEGSARRAIKDEIVTVSFAAVAGVLQSAVGSNRYAVGDALITGITGDRWCVSRLRFDEKYRAVPPTCDGESGKYRNRPVTVLAKQMNVAFTVLRSPSGDILSGREGDWLVQYAPGDHGVVARLRFDAVYRLIG